MLQWNRWWRLCHMSGHAHSCLCLPACVLCSSHFWCCALPLEGPPSSLVRDTHFSSLCYWVLPMASLAAFLWYKPPAVSVRNIESSQVIITYPPSLSTHKQELLLNLYLLTPGYSWIHLSSFQLQHNNYVFFTRNQSYSKLFEHYYVASLKNISTENHAILKLWMRAWLDIEGAHIYLYIYLSIYIPGQIINWNKNI